MWAMAMATPGVFVPVTVPRPRPDDLSHGQVLVRVLAGGICGSDVPYLRGLPSRFPGSPMPGHYGAPGFPLHEIAGEVVAADDPDLSPGDLVVGWAESFDGLAEFAVTDATSLAWYDSRLSPAEAVVAQPLACVLYAVDRIGDVRSRACAVLGLGPIGLLFAHVLASRGGQVVGVDPVDRHPCADQFGLDQVQVATSMVWVEGLREEDRPDVVVEAVGHQVATLADAVHAVRRSGRVFYFGVPDSPSYPLDMGAMVHNNLTLQAGGTEERRRMLTEAGAYLARHAKLGDSLVSHVFGRNDVQAAYDTAAQARPGRLKVVLDITATR